MSQNDLLSETLIQELAAIRNGLERGIDLLEKINHRALKTGLDLQQVPDYPLRMTINDVGRLITAHLDAEQELRDKAMERLKATT